MKVKPSKEATDKAARLQRVMEAHDLLERAVRLVGIDEAKKCFRGVVGMIRERDGRRWT